MVNMLRMLVSPVSDYMRTGIQTFQLFSTLTTIVHQEAITCAVMLIVLGRKLLVCCVEGLNWFKHICIFRRKGLGTAYNATMPSPGKVCTKDMTELNSLQGDRNVQD